MNTLNELIKEVTLSLRERKARFSKAVEAGKLDKTVARQRYNALSDVLDYLNNQAAMQAKVLPMTFSFQLENEAMSRYFAGIMSQVNGPRVVVCQLIPFSDGELHEITGNIVTPEKARQIGMVINQQEVAHAV